MIRNLAALAVDLLAYNRGIRRAADEYAARPSAACLRDDCPNLVREVDGLGICVGCRSQGWRKADFL